MSEETFEKLRNYDTPTVCNAIELFDVRPRNQGFMSGEIRAQFPDLPPIVGYATTATFRSAHALEGGEVYSSLADQVATFERELPRPRIVVFQDLDETACGATFGEVMCTTYQTFGCVGLITSGGARDLDQVHEKGFACFASSAIASHAYCRIVDVHVPVTVGGVLIRPGDVLHADCNGVTTIPRDLVAEVALACGKLAEAESMVLGYLEANPSPEGLGSAHLEMKARFGQIADEVRRELEGTPVSKPQN